MGYTAMLLIVLIGGAGFIAYIGDLLGRRMGKARLTLFGMRPRHTAILMTSVTGMLIAALTLGLMVAVNREYARVLLEGPKLITQNRKLQVQNKALERGRKALETRASRAQEDAADAEKAAEKARKDLRRAKDELEKARKVQAELDSRIRRQQGLLKEYEVRLADEQAKLAQARREVARAQEDIRKATRILTEQSKLAAEAVQKAGITLAGYRELREKRVIFEAGEEVARYVIPYTPSITDLRKQVYRGLDVASSRAEARGAVKGKTGRAVVIAPAVFREMNTGKEQRFQEPQSVNAIAEQILSNRESVVMQITAPGNIISGETMPVAVKLFRNRQIFAEGDVVACADIDGSLPGDSVSAAVREFLAVNVRSAAVEADLIPRLKGGGEPSYFELDVDRIADLVARARAAGRSARVCARAGTGISSAGPLVLEFSVQKR